MEFLFRRSYRGPIKLVVFDWAGTMIDYGSRAPAGAFIEGYRRNKIEITMAQARAPMGMGKWEHIKTIGEMEPVAAQWQEVHGREMTKGDIDEMYEEFVPVLLDILPDYSTLIPGVTDTVAYLKERGIMVAGTTGYFDEAMEVCREAAAKQGYIPDFSVCATQVSAGRPAPWLIYRAMNELNVYPPQAVVKVGDTKPDIQAALNAGAWAVGAAKAGNEVGLSEEELLALPEEEQTKRINKARQVLAQEGAHAVVDTVADLPDVIEQIEALLAQGEQP
ncbi:MAG: phosphonoacetaldehyde hydrolase [Chloroflexota bacterium]